MINKQVLFVVRDDRKVPVNTRTLFSPKAVFCGRGDEERRTDCAARARVARLVFLFAATQIGISFILKYFSFLQ